MPVEEYPTLPQIPEQSGLLLADGWLTIYNILTGMRLQAWLVTVGPTDRGAVTSAA